VLIGAPVGDVIAEVAVAPGHRVAAGAVLLRLDTRVAEARLVVDRAAVASAAAALTTAQVALDQAEDRQRRARSDVDSVEELARRRFAVASAAAGIAQAEAAVAQARATLAASEVELERRTIRAPRAGTILRVDARAGEFAPAGRIDPPLVTLGDLSAMQVRIDIDENDAWRVRDGAKAEGAVRGNPGLRLPLQFERIEPYVVPKRSLTGLSAERVDTRVLQVIYRVARSDVPLYAGQQLDVFIDAGAATASTVP
jgi:HlyD family secretion protein